MWSVRKGSVWTVEGSVVDGCGWKGRIVAVYEDVKSDTGDAKTKPCPNPWTPNTIRSSNLFRTLNLGQHSSSKPLKSDH